MSVDEFAGAVPAIDDLKAAAAAAEFHKLVGGPAADVMASIDLLARGYREVGGFDRPWAGISIGDTASIPMGVSVSAEPVGRVHWSDEAALEAEYVERRRREVEAQLRNPKNVSELKALYGNRCLFCDRRIVVGVRPDRFYSEAAHVRPLGKPHNGPDQKINMILLCPEHHLQFDRGVLRINWNEGVPLVTSRVSGDPLEGRPVTLKAPHTLDRVHVDWHFAFWNPN